MIVIQEPIIKGKALPAGTTIKVCPANDAECNRQFAITKNVTCLDISILNFKQDNLTPADFGDYQISIPFEVAQKTREGFITTNPSEIEVHFKIALPPTPTPLPTQTPFPADLMIDCEGKSNLDFGTIDKPSAGTEGFAEQTCTLHWKDSHDAAEVTLSLLWDEFDVSSPALSDFVNLKAGTQEGKQITLSPNDNTFSTTVNIPAGHWASMTTKQQTFEGALEISPEYVNIEDDPENVDNEHMMGVAFKVVRPMSPLIWIGVGAVVLLIGIWITRPRFPKEFIYEIDYRETYPYDYSKNWWTGGIKICGKDANEKHFKMGNESISDCLHISPSWHGSLLGKMLGQKKNITYKIIPQYGCSVEKFGTITESDQITKVGNRERFTLITESNRYPVEIYARNCRFR